MSTITLNNADISLFSLFSLFVCNMNWLMLMLLVMMLIIIMITMLAIATLKHVPQYGSREARKEKGDEIWMINRNVNFVLYSYVIAFICAVVNVQILIVYSSLSSCDPGDIFSTIEVRMRF